MTMKLVGAFLIILGCGGFCFHVAFSQKREEHLLQQLIHILDYITCELQYRHTVLPDLCKQAAKERYGVLSRVFLELSKELEQQIAPDVSVCMRAALSRVTDIPDQLERILLNLGCSLGRFDLDGQLVDLDMVKHQCREKLSSLHLNRDTRLRTYQTLGLCAGAALVILFI